MKKLINLFIFVVIFMVATVNNFAQTQTANTAQIVAVSWRGFVGTGENIGVAGFVIAASSAADTNSTKTVIIRGVGPSLVKYLNGYMTDTKLELYQRYTDSAGNSQIKLVAENSHWAGAPDELADTNKVGLAPIMLGSNDSVIVARLPAGIYTAQLSGPAPANVTGIGLIEVYDVSRDTGKLRLSAVSTRAYVGTGNNDEVVGLIIDGQGQEKLIVRGVGPGLSNFGITGYLSDPSLTIYNGQAKPISFNDDWVGNVYEMLEVYKVGLFPLDLGSKDALLTPTLDPGAYTIHCRGVKDVTGVGLVEVYEDNSRWW